MKCIIITATIFQGRDFDRFGVDYFLKAGYEVVVWELLNLYNPNYSLKYSPFDISLYENIVQLDTWHDIQHNLGQINIDRTFVSVHLTIDDKTFPVFEMLQKRKVVFAIYNRFLPILKIKMGFSLASVLKMINVFNKFTNWKRRRKRTWAKRRILQGGIPLYIVLGGTVAEEQSSDIFDAAEHVIWIHTFDYDIYLKRTEFNKGNSFPEDSYAVFLDEYFPFHPDFILLKSAPPIKPEDYYPGLNLLFERVEKELGLPVVIAAHPRSRYTELPDYFDSRQVILGKTIQLVENAKLVLSHSSESNNFTVLCEKPTIHITNNKLEKTIFKTYINSWAKTLNRPIINVDEFDTLANGDELFEIDKVANKTYKDKYIKKVGTPEENTWDIVIDYLDTDIFEQSIP